MPSQSPIPTPAIADGRLYTGGGFSSTEFYCFDAKSDRPIWQRTVSDDGPSAPVVSDDTVVCNTESCTLFALNTKNGNMLWSLYLGNPLMSTPTVSDGRVFTVYPALFPPDQLKQKPKQPVPAYVCICMDLKTGGVLWQKWVDGDCMTTPVAADGHLYVVTFPGTMYVFDQRSGEVRSARAVR
ncbi:MAG: PQQ-binding-like beta-propeller repeat protein, partial [Fuerstiella sp.]